MRGLGVELGGVDVFGVEVSAGQLDGHHLEAEAEAEVRHVVQPGVAGGLDLALEPALAEAAGDYDAVDPGEQLVRVSRCDVFRVHPVHLHG